MVYYIILCFWNGSKSGQPEDRSNLCTLTYSSRDMRSLIIKTPNSWKFDNDFYTVAESLMPARISHKHDIQNSKPHASITKTRSCNIQTFSAVKINKFH